MAGKKQQRLPLPVMVTPEVWESLWRVVDASRNVILRTDPQAHEEALEFLADQEKMLRRAIGFFHGPPDTAEQTLRGDVATKHPHILNLESERRTVLINDLTTFSELGMGPMAERK